MNESRPVGQVVPHRARSASSGRGVIRPIYAGVFDIDVHDFDVVANTVRGWMQTHRTVGDLVRDIDMPYFSINRLVDEGLVAEVAQSV